MHPAQDPSRSEFTRLFADKLFSSPQFHLPVLLATDARTAHVPTLSAVALHSDTLPAAASNFSTDPQRESCIQLKSDAAYIK
jgi:hypothetical protein